MSRYNTYTPGTDHVDQLFSAFILKLSNFLIALNTFYFNVDKDKV